MKKFAPLMFAVFLFSCSLNKKGVDFAESTFNEALALAQNQHKMVMVYFWSDG